MLDDMIKIADVNNWDNEKKLKLARDFALNIPADLPKKIEARAFTLKSKIPFKATCLREVLLHRIAELASVAVELYEKDKLVPAFIITRAVVETASMIFWLNEKISDFFLSKDVKLLDGFLMKAMLGSRDGTTELESYNILTAVDRVNKRFSGFRRMYDRMCEFTHPNWSGSLGSYGKIDKKHQLNLGANLRRPPIEFGLDPLIWGLGIFEYYYNDLADRLYDLNNYFDVER